jgi:hypothetical protein
MVRSDEYTVVVTVLAAAGGEAGGGAAGSAAGVDGAAGGDAAGTVRVVEVDGAAGSTGAGALRVVVVFCDGDGATGTTRSSVGTAPAGAVVLPAGGGFAAGTVDAFGGAIVRVCIGGVNVMI